MLDTYEESFNNINSKKFTSVGEARMTQWANSYKINHLLCNLREHENHQYKVWKRGADRFSEFANNLTENDVISLIKVGEEVTGTSGYLKYGELKIYSNEHKPKGEFECSVNHKGKFRRNYGEFDPDYLYTRNLKLIAGVAMKVNEFIEEGGSFISRYDYCMVIEKIIQYVQLWEDGLNLDLNIHFVKNLLSHIALSMITPLGRRCINASDYLPCKIDPSKKLYFAYGSNMDVNQMAYRCPNSTIAGIQTLANYKFFINSRGVASVLPVLGETCIGLLWNIAEEDWKSLDKYEGVASNFYKRKTIPLSVKNKFLDVEIYFATHFDKGKPRPGYQEKIVNAAKDLSNDVLLGLEKRNYKTDGDLNFIIEEFTGDSERWIKDLSTWKDVKNG